MPRNNVLFVGALALMGALALPAVAGAATGYELGASLLNFGALLAFMGVNAAAFVRYGLRAQHRGPGDVLPPVLGFVVCGLLFWSLSTQARLFGAAWMLVGVALGMWRTRGFRRNLAGLDVTAEEERG